MKNLKIFTIMLAFVLALSVTAFGQTITSTTTGGNWNAGGTWEGGVVPGASNDVVIADGATVTINADVTVASITVGQGTSGILTFDPAAIRAVVVSGNVTVAAGGSFITQSATTRTHTLAIGGDLTNSGTFDMSRGGTTLICNVTFNKNGNQTVSGSGGTTRFNLITLNMGTSNANILEVTSTNFAAAAAFLTLTNGTFKISGSFTFTNTFFTSAAYSITANCGIWLNNPNVTVTAQNGSPTLFGLLRVTAGAYNIGTGTGNSITYNTTVAPAAKMTIEGGSLTVAGRISRSGTTQILEYNQSGGTVTVTNVGSASGRPSFEVAGANSSFIMSGGTTIVRGAGSTGPLDVDVSAGTSNLTGGTLQIGSATTPASSNFRVTGNAYNFTVNSANNPAVTLGGNLSVNGTLTLNGTGAFTVGANTLTLNNPIAGTPANLSAGSTSSITVAGSASGINIPSSVSTLNNLTLNNANGTTLQGGLAVNGTLTFTSGKVTLGANNLTVAALSGGSSSNYVVATGAGELRKTFSSTGSFTYPVGDASNYSPVTLNFTSGTFSSAYAGVKLVNAKHSLNTSANDYLNRYWTVISSGITDFSCNATFNYVQSDVNGTESNLFAGKLNGSAWNIFGLVDIGANTLSGTIDSFSDFTAGEALAMPVQLASFIGNVVGNNAQLEWETVSEINNFGFNIQKFNSVSNNYETIGFVAGKGVPSSYMYLDENASGSLEYRLEQIDNNGLSNYFGPIMLNPNSVGNDAVPAVFALNQNYPNPFNPSTTISFSLANSGYTTLKVYNLLGNEVANLFNGNAEAGKMYNVKFDASNLATGIYLYKLQNGSSVEVRKLTLVK